MAEKTTAEGKDELSCALPSSEMLPRIAKWQALSVEAVSRVTGPGRVSSRYPRTADIASRLEELIEAESECCPFLEFTVTNDGDFIEAELRFRPEFEPIVALIVPADT